MYTLLSVENYRQMIVITGFSLNIFCVCTCTMSVCYFVEKKLQRFDTIRRAEKFIVELCALVQFDMVHCMGNTV